MELLGIEDSIFILSNLRKYNMLREIEIVRLFLKHCRQQGYVRAFNALQEETGVRLEDDKMTELHEILVNRGDFKKTEEMLIDFIASECCLGSNLSLVLLPMYLSFPARKPR